MKVLALINTLSKNPLSQWQFDRVLATIAYDFDIHVVFLGDGLEQCKNNIKWNSLEVYGIKNVFFVNESRLNLDSNIDIKLKEISKSKVSQLIRRSDIIL